MPTKDIDKVWHTHILDTKLYFYHCQLLFGEYLHHFPYFGIRGELDKANLAAAFEQTLELFRLHQDDFGLELWEKVNIMQASCGNNCGSSLCDQQACDRNSCGSGDGDGGTEFSNMEVVKLYSIRPSLTR